MIKHRENINIMELVFLFGLVFLHCITAVPLRLFYPYGESRGDSKLYNGDDTSSPEIQINNPVHYYDDVFSSLFVSIHCFVDHFNKNFHIG